MKLQLFGAAESKVFFQIKKFSSFSKCQRNILAHLWLDEIAFTLWLPSILAEKKNNSIILKRPLYPKNKQNKQKKKKLITPRTLLANCANLLAARRCGTYN